MVVRLVDSLLTSPGLLTPPSTHDPPVYHLQGDGLSFPADYNDPQYAVGECPECSSWPTVLRPASGIKACVFDNGADPTFKDPYFFKSSMNLASEWDAVEGNQAAESHFSTGGHCMIHSIEDIMDCLDNGTSKLSSPDLDLNEPWQGNGTWLRNGTMALQSGAAAASGGVGAAVVFAAAAHLLGALRSRR